MLISNYINKHIFSISHPYNSLESINIPDLSTLSRLFDLFLLLPDNKNFADQLIIAVEDQQNLPFGDIRRRIANLCSLVIAVESCLKAICRLRYSGDAVKLTQVESPGLTLRGLLEHGWLLPKMLWDENYTNKKHCPVYWSQQDCLTAIAYRVYLLRNEFSHKSPIYSLEELTSLFNITLALLILVIRYGPNHIVLELAISPYLKYLEWVSQSLDRDYDRYVSLQAFLKWEPNSLDDLPISLEQSESSITYPIPKGPEEISQIVKQLHKMVLIGGGGAGKSHTLKHITVLLAKEILALQSSPRQIPIYLPANVLGNGNNLLKYLFTFLKNFEGIDIESDLFNGQLWLFIDGLNEIPPKYYHEVIQDIKAFLIIYPKCRLLVSTRQELYHNELPLPVYEILPLTPHLVEEILRLNATTEKKGKQLFSLVKTDKRLLALFKTPLMSRLLCELPTQMRIPRSIGEMMNVLFNQVFEREERKGDQVPKCIKVMILVDMAQIIRNNLSTVIHEEEILYTFENITRRFAQDISPTYILTRLIESSVLERRDDGYIGFFHETALDYFFALNLKKIWEDNPSTEAKNTIMTATKTSIEILSGLLDSGDTFTRFIAQNDLKLACQCYSARSNRSKLLFKELLAEIKFRLQTQSIEDTFIALEAMAILDEFEATQAIFKILPELSQQAQTVASDALVKYAPSGVTEEVHKFLVSGAFVQQLVAIKFTIAHQLIEVTLLLINLAELHQINLQEVLSEALGCLESPESLNYLQQQCNTNLENRTIQLDIAIKALNSKKAEPILKLALEDADINVRLAATIKIDAINISTLDTEIFNLVVNEPNFLIRLIGTQIILRRVDKPCRITVIQRLFSTPPISNESLPASRIMDVVSLLHQDELEDVALQALCTPHVQMQSLIITKILERNSALALNILDLVDFEDMKITSGAKAALIRSVIYNGYINLEMLEKAMKPTLPAGIRLAVINMLNKLPINIISIILQKALSDPSENVRAVSVKSLGCYPELCTEQVIEPLIFDLNKSVQKYAWRLVNQHSIFENNKLLNWTEISYPIYLRIRAIQELCSRRFKWDLKMVCSFVQDKDYGIQRQGYLILEAISKTNLKHIGKVKNWVQCSYGFLVRLDTKEKLFFHISNLTDRQYIPKCNDLVNFKIGEIDIDHIKPCAIQVSFICRSHRNQIRKNIR